MQVREIMTTDLLTAGPEEPIRAVAQRMVTRWVGAAVVAEGPNGRPGILTQWDVTRLVASGGDLGAMKVAEAATPEATCVAPGWSLVHAAETMTAGGFRHLVVADAGRTVGIVSIRDIARTWVGQRAGRPMNVEIRDAMSRDLVLLGRNDRLSEAAQRMVAQKASAAVVEPPKPKAPPGIITDRDMLMAVAEARDPQAERVGDHLASRMTFSAPDWSLAQAGQAMIKGGFQHVVVVDAHGVNGVISMSDVIRRWIA